MALDTFTDDLRRNGYSVTRPRTIVFETLYVSGPISPAELGRQLDHQLDRASVYRTITLFEQLGYIRRVPRGWKYLIELSDRFSHHHHHLLCRICGKTVEINNDHNLEAVLSKMTESYGYSDLIHELELTGICEHCSKNMEPRLHNRGSLEASHFHI